MVVVVVVVVIDSKTHLESPFPSITRSHPEMVGDMLRVTLNFDLSKIPFVHF